MKLIVLKHKFPEEETRSVGTESTNTAVLFNVTSLIKGLQSVQFFQILKVRLQLLNESENKC